MGDEIISNPEKYEKIVILDEDDKGIVFSAATHDPKLIRLQKDVTEFVTQIILKHEREYYYFVHNNFHSERIALLGETNKSVIEVIVAMTNKFYNVLYKNIQNSVIGGQEIEILDMCKMADYGPHILLDRLIKLTLDLHIEVVRESLEVNDDYEAYIKSVLKEINYHLISRNLLDYLKKCDDDDTPFMILSDDQDAFSIKIERNVDIL